MLDDEQEMPAGLSTSMRKTGRKPALAGLLAQPRASASSLVEDDLRQAIISMYLKPGTALIEKELTAHYGFSRTPVREAMIRLKDDGLVEIFPQSGTFVARIPVQSIPEAVLIRQALESMAAERAATAGNRPAQEAMDRLIARQHHHAQQADQQAFHEADEAFHAAISDAGHCPGIWRLAQTVKAQVDRCRRLTLPVPGRMERVIAEHQLILDAIRAGNAHAARHAVMAHLEAVIPDIDQMRLDNPGYFI